MAHETFISYSTKDKAVADAVCARLEQDSCRCWYAPRDIAPGADWAGSIIEAIEHSKVMVLIFTDYANESRQVLREINNAVRCGVVIVPFRLTKTSPAGSMRYYLSTVHWLDALNGELEENIARLSELVRTILAGKQEPEPEKDRTPLPALTAQQQAPPQQAESAADAAPAPAPVSLDTDAAKPEFSRLVPYSAVIHLLLKLFCLPVLGYSLFSGSSWLPQATLAVFTAGYVIDLIPALPIKGRPVIKSRLILGIAGLLTYLLFTIRISIYSEAYPRPLTVLLSACLLCFSITLYVCSKQDLSWAAKKGRWIYHANKIFNLVLLIILAPIGVIMIIAG